MLTEKELQKEIRSVEAGKRKEIKVDDNLFLEVLCSGKTVWRFRFYENGAHKKKKLGEYPLLSMKEARVKRDEARIMLASGESPMRDRKKEVTLTEAFDAWMKKKVEGEYTE